MLLLGDKNIQTLLLCKKWYHSRLLKLLGCSYQPMLCERYPASINHG